MNSDEKIARLEERLTWQEDLLDALNAQVAQLNAEQAALQRQLQLLYREIQSIQGGAASNSAVQEIPPHY